MEKNNFNKAYIYIIAIFAIGIAISNIISFFNGVGFALIGTCLFLILAISNILKDEANKKRFGDIFILIAIEFIMLLILFFAYDFNLNGITNKFPLVMRNICAIYSLLSAGYVVFRYVSEIKGKKYNVVEYILGNYTPQPKVKKVKTSKAEVKKNKELENGTLAPKPSSIEPSVVANTEMEEQIENQTETNVQTEVDEAQKTTNSEGENPDNKPNDSNTSNTTYKGFWY